MNRVWTFFLTKLKLVFIAMPLLILSVCCMYVFCKYQRDLDAEIRLSFADALYVTDKDITKIYSPGSSVQRSVLAKIASQEGISEMTLAQPFLYRMGLDASDGSEGMLMLNFSPAHPEMAKGLRQK